MKKSILFLVGLLTMTAGPLAADALLERGAYLMGGIVACGNCHTPKTPQGGLAPGMELAGGFLIEFDEFTSYAPNITPDAETGIGA
ncbi:MAG: hypothetical protein VCD50_03925 [Alphaproteobacteria bacterium]